MAGMIDGPYGHFSTFSGGTRTSVKKHRPWQVPLRFPADPKASDGEGGCSFCNKTHEEERRSSDGCRMGFKNRYTPFPFHRLVIPIKHPHTEAEVRDLTAETLLGDWHFILEEIRLTYPQRYPVWVITYRGWGAGQNVPHSHWHILQPTGQSSPLRSNQSLAALPEGQILHRQSDFNLTTAGFGPRTGQMLIFSPDQGFGRACSRPFLDILADQTARLIKLFARKFLDDTAGGSGLPPDYMLMLVLNSSADWYINYVPILNNQGGTEIMAMMTGTPYVISWPHGVTIEYLKS